MPYIPVSYNPNPIYPENEGNPFATVPQAQPSTLWENVKASFDEGIRMGAPSSVLHGINAFMAGNDWGSKRLSDDEVTNQLVKRGLAGHLAIKNYGYTQKQLDILCEQKERELQNQDVLARNDSYFVSAINFGTRIAAGLTDPTNHIPIGLIGNAKYLKTLQSAGGFWSRNVARVAMSAVNAVPGNVITESIVAPIQAGILQANYGAEDYFANIGIGSIAGGILGATTGRLGLISELRNAWSGTRQPWQITLPTDRTIQLRDNWANQQAEAMLRANPTLNETAVRQNAQATAAVFDAYARTLAYDTKRAVEDIYARYAPTFDVAEAPVLESVRVTSEVGANPELVDYRISTDGNVVEGVPADVPDAKQLTVRSYAEANKISVAEAARRLEDAGYAVPRGEAQANGRRGRVKVTEPITSKVTPETRININRAVANAAEALNTQLPVSREALDVSGRVLDIANERVGAAIDAAVRSAAPDAIRLANDIARTGEINLNTPELARTVQAVGALVNTVSNEVAGATDAIGTQVVRAANEVLPRLEAAVNEATRVTGGTPNQAAQTAQQPLNVRARTRWNPNGKAVVDFFQTTDLTSAPHEMFHIFRRMVADAAEDPNAAANVKSHWDTIRDFVGAKENSPLSVEMEEKFARAGERYLLNGEAPNPKLNDVFTRMRQWFLEVYGNANEAGLRISPEMQRTFDDMLRLPPEAIEDGLRYSLEELQIRNPATEAGDVYDHTSEAGDDITETIKPDTVDTDYQNTVVRAGEAGAIELDAELAPLRAELQRLNTEPEVARNIAESIISGRSLDEVSMELAGDAWTPEQINELYQTVMAGHQKGLSLQDILSKLQQATDQKVRENLLQQRATILNRRARDAALERVFTNFQGQEAEGVASLLAGSNLLREEGRLTADALASAKRNRYISGLVADIEKLPKATQRMFLEDACELDLARALWSIDNPHGRYNGPPEVMDIAKAIHKWQEIARTGANDAGASIGKLDGYIIHQTHNADRIREAGPEVWRDDIASLLDWEKTADGRYETDIDGRERFLQGAFKDLSTGYHNHVDGTREPIMTRGTIVGSTASGVSQPRTLHFKDADSWYQYHQKYGDSSIRESVASNLDHLANATGMMQILGPSAHSNLKRIVDVTLDRLRSAGRVDEMNKLQRSYEVGFIHNCMMELDGSISRSGNPRLAKIFGTARDLLSTAQLGSSLFSQFADIPNAAAELRYQGHNYFSELFSEVTNMGRYWGNNSQEMKQMWAGLGAYADDVLREFQSRWRVEDSTTRGTWHKVENAFYKLAGMEKWDQTHRKGVATKMAYHLAQDSVKSWDELKPQMRRVFSLAGIDADRWEVIRHADKITADSNTYLSPESVRNLPDGVIRQYLDARGQSSTPIDIRMARNDIADRLSSWFWDRNTYAVISPDVRTRAIMRQGLPSGTPIGEVVRSVGQFKSFTISEMQRTYAREVYGYGEDTFWRGMRQRFSSFSGESGFMPMVNMMAVGTLYGMFSLQSKELAKGRTLRDMRDPHTWVAAYAQSGGMGIYGDFLFGERSRFGGGPLVTALGPLVSSADELLDIVQGIRDGDDVASQLASFAWRHTPGNNLWFMRAAMNQLVMYRIQEALKPGYLNRMEKRIGKQNDQNFLIRPSWNPWTEDWNWDTIQGRDYRQAQ